MHEQLGGRDVRLGQVPPARDAPVVHVKAYAVMGEVEVKTKTGTERVRELANGWRRHLERPH